MMIAVDQILLRCSNITKHYLQHHKKILFKHAGEKKRPGGRFSGSEPN
jgi:hypothetical protein